MSHGVGNAISLPIIGIVLIAVVCNPHASWWYGSFAPSQSGLDPAIADSEAAKRSDQVQFLRDQHGGNARGCSNAVSFGERKYDPSSS